MNVADFLLELRNRDIQIRADSDQLRCNAPAGVLTPGLREQLRQYKSEILEFLRAAELLARQERAIIPLQPRGDRIPIFAVGGHNGDVFCYRALAQHLGEDQPFFGLQPPGLDGHSEPLARVEELAAYFAAQIKTFRPGGPYVIAGYCAGCTIAFELAQQLLQDGAAISFVAMFGPYFLASNRLVLRFAQWRQRLATHVRALALLSSFEGRRDYLADRLRKGVMALLARRSPGTNDPELVLRSRVEDVTMGAVRRYTPSHFAGIVSLFLPSREWARLYGAPTLWRSVSERTEDYIGPDDCDAGNMLLEPHAKAIADLFRRCCENSKMEEARSQALRRGFLLDHPNNYFGRSLG